MKEFILTQSYATIEDMVNSGEVAVYREELQQGNIEFYAIVSRIGNRYDICGNKISGYVQNPYLLINVPVEETIQQDAVQNVTKPAEVVEIEEKKEEETDMKYAEIEALIDAEIEKVKATYEQEIAILKEQHEKELADAKEQAKAELIAKLNG